jgi:hypothetical protein
MPRPGNHRALIKRKVVASLAEAQSNVWSFVATVEDLTNLGRLGGKEDFRLIIPSNLRRIGRATARRLKKAPDNVHSLGMSMLLVAYRNIGTQSATSPAKQLRIR